MNYSESLNILLAIFQCVIHWLFHMIKKNDIHWFLILTSIWLIMSIYKHIVVYILISNLMMIMIYKMLQDMNEKNLKECHNLNIIFFNYRNVMIYSFLFFMQIDYVKNIILMLEFMLNSIVFIEYEYIKQIYELNIIMNFKMRLK